LPIQTHQ